ncbi:hypothetical protein CsSME_00047069 [Camellia sinensis var. sinensis]
MEFVGEKTCPSSSPTPSPIWVTPSATSDPTQPVSLPPTSTPKTPPPLSAPSPAPLLVPTLPPLSPQIIRKQKHKKKKKKKKANQHRYSLFFQKQNCFQSLSSQQWQLIPLLSHRPLTVLSHSTALSLPVFIEPR